MRHNRSEPPFLYWGLLWGLGSAIPLASFGIDYAHPNFNHIIGRDFSNAWLAGKLALEGSPQCPFDVRCFRISMFDKLGMLSMQNYSYPPHTLFIDAPFALLSYHAALVVWTIFGCVLFYQAAKSWIPEGLPKILALLTPAALINIWNGHYGFVLGALWLWFFRDLNKKPARSGVYASLMTFKPHMGLMIAVATLSRRNAVLVACGATIALIISSALAFGPETWTSFLSSTTVLQAHILTRNTADFYFRMMPSAYVAFGRGVIGTGAQIAFTLAALLILAKHRKIEPFAFATATFVILPYSFGYDMTVACLGFAILLWSQWESLGLVERAVLSLAFLSPELSYFVPWIVPPTLIAALHIQFTRPLCYFVNENIAEVVGDTLPHAARVNAEAVG